MGLLRVFEAALGDLGVNLAELRKCETGCGARQWRPGTLRPASWRAWRRLPFRPSATVFRYDFGLFRQIIAQGWQQEYPDEWLSYGKPLGIPAAGGGLPVHFGGGVEHVETKGRERAVWHPAETVQAVAYDTPIVGGAASTQRVAAVVGALARPAQARRVQHRRLSRASARRRAPNRSASSCIE